MCVTIMEEKIWKVFHMNIKEEDLKEGWHEFWWYLVNHSAFKTEYYFGQGIIDMIKEYYKEAPQK